MLKKSISVILSIVFLMLCVFTLPATAIGNEFNVEDYTIEEILEMTPTEKMNLINAFIEEYNPYGLRDLIDENVNQGSAPGIQPLWASDSNRLESGQQMATHQYITLEATLRFMLDWGFYDIDVTQQLIFAFALAAASGLPDIEERDNLTYAGHFYDPDTGKNYLLQTSPTAKTRAGEHYAVATGILDQNTNVNSGLFMEAWEELGRALHYLQDVCEPHHASNQIAGLSSHSEFEDYINKNIDTLLPEVPEMSVDFYRYSNNRTVQTLTHEAAIFGKSYIDEVGRLDVVSGGSIDYSKWEAAANDCLINSIGFSARIIYKLFSDNLIID